MEKLFLERLPLGSSTEQPIPVLKTILRSLEYEGMGHREADILGGNKAVFDEAFGGTDIYDEDKYEEATDSTELTDSMLDSHRLARRGKTCSRGNPFFPMKEWQELSDYLTCKKLQALYTWLSSDSRLEVFWVTGLLGSGKSTFMKLLSTRKKTHVALAAWAKSEIYMLKYYVWNPGCHDLQRSFKGFLYATLHQLLVFYDGSLIEQIAS